jgi:transcriptional regulator with XRE-family HTH domain
MNSEKNIFVQKLGNAIRKHRIKRKFTLEKLALITGLNYSHISKIERGIINPSIYNLFIISTILEVPICKLISDPQCKKGINFEEKAPIGDHLKKENILKNLVDFELN